MLRKRGGAVLKLANANPGLKVNRRIHFSGKKMFPLLTKQKGNQYTMNPPAKL